jgi:hypothetical protein
VGFYVIAQLLIRLSAFVRYWRKNESIMRLYISYSQTSRKPMFQYNIPIEFGVLIKLVKLIRMCLN